MNSGRSYLEGFSWERYEQEADESQHRARNNQDHTIFPSYIVEGDTIKPVRERTEDFIGTHHYFPIVRPRLPFELAKVPDGDTNGALRFVQNVLD
jgi:hypothetical protein